MPHVVEENLGLLTVGDVARRLRISRRTVWRWSAAGRLPAPLRLGPQCTRWRAAEIQRYVDALRPIDRSA
jgi:prophage regulatory protein